MPSQRIITLTTDFGLSDHYVGAMKGVILNIHPEARIVEITNAVQSFDVLDGALAIANAYSYFPSDSIHLVVVDPGVGSSRRPLVVTTSRHTFVAPDNGVLSLVYEREERVSVRHITSEHYFLQPVSQTFHGRDIFSPVAAHLSKGVGAAKFGEEITDYLRFAAPRPKLDGTVLKGLVMKVDRFGNLITNISARDVPELFGQSPPAFTLSLGKAQISQIQQSYAAGAAGEPFVIIGSMGYLEVACNRAAAAQVTGASKGSEVALEIKK